MVVVIPSYNEPDLMSAVNSLLACDVPLDVSVEVIVVVNYPKNSDNKVVNVSESNVKSVSNCIFEQDKIALYSIFCPDLPTKHAGVGWARKIGMDEALRRLAKVNNNGLICCFDADSLVDKSYFSAIWNQFKNNSFNGASIHFEHPISGDNFEDSIYKEIVKYELHLRYYKNALMFCGLPYAYHTVGSSMVVKASAYALQGGMNRKKAGEDFYFINKIIALGNYSRVTSTTVFPSPRISDRVPFGTGRAIKESIEGCKDLSITYNFEIFIAIKSWVNLVINKQQYDYNSFSSMIRSFLSEQFWNLKLSQLQQNTSSLALFNSQFFKVFDAFWMLKCVHHLKANFFDDTDLLINTNSLLAELRCPKMNNVEQALVAFRNLDKKIGETKAPLK